MSYTQPTKTVPYKKILVIFTKKKKKKILSAETCCFTFM